MRCSRLPSRRFLVLGSIALLALSSPAGSAQADDSSDSPVNPRPTQQAESDASEPIDTVLFGSCIEQHQPVPILQTMIAQQPDLMLFIGDNIYADTQDMSVMRAKYAKLGRAAGFDRLTEQCPTLATWDDHDYGLNDGGANYAQRAAAQQVFCDFWNVPEGDPRRQRPGVYHAQEFGPPSRRLQVILLDTRYFRSPLKKGERRVGGPYRPDDDPSKTMLGEQQWQWLEEQLRVPARVRLIVTSIQCVAEAAGQETWSNLPRERRRLFRLIDATGADGVILISGDRHWSELSVARDTVAYPLYDLTSSSLNQIHGRGTPTENRYRAVDATWHRPNFGVIQIDWQPADPRITLQVRDLDNQARIEKTLRLSELQSHADPTAAKP